MQIWRLRPRRARDSLSRAALVERERKRRNLWIYRVAFIVRCGMVC